MTLSDDELRSLVELTVANELDVITHSAEIAERYGGTLDALVVRAERHLSAKAAESWRAARPHPGPGSR